MYNVFVGFGLGLQAMAILVGLPQMVPAKRISLVMGFVLCSAGIGYFLYAPLCRLLTNAYGQVLNYFYIALHYKTLERAHSLYQDESCGLRVIIYWFKLQVARHVPNNRGNNA